ncbi:hypothetical protein OIU84_007551 [Salix udensis]|uniref:Uncharacterized protein n=1 Tax=Salix udensis TaxID=889485 RepID=A0AAD6NZN6_9ROSI|nr:hypothetical protein OIU84_007551 [Salix udensis]
MLIQEKLETMKDPILSQDRSLKSQLSNDHTDENDESFTEDRDLNILLSQNSEQEHSFRSSVGGNSSFKSVLRQDSMPPKGAVDGITTKKRMHRRTSTEWSIGSGSDRSLVGSTNSPQESFPREFQEASDETIERLKSELSGFMRQSELSELELQTLRKQITKESRRGQDLSRQVKELEEERDELKTECEQLKSSRKFAEAESLNQLRAEYDDSLVQLEEVRRELSHQKEFEHQS